jgi:hypothetical protein
MDSKYLSLRVVSLMVVLMSTVYSCAPPKPHPAVSAYQQLIAAFSSAQPDEVWRLLARESRIILLRRLSSLDVQEQTREAGSEVESQEALNKTPAHLKIELDWALESPFTARAKLASSQSADLASQDPSRFQEVSVFYASQAWLIPAIFENGAWRIHLLGARPTTSTSPLPHR